MFLWWHPEEVRHGHVTYWSHSQTTDSGMHKWIYTGIFCTEKVFSVVLKSISIILASIGSSSRVDSKCPISPVQPLSHLGYWAAWTWRRMTEKLLPTLQLQTCPILIWSIFEASYPSNSSLPQENGSPERDRMKLLRKECNYIQRIVTHGPTSSGLNAHKTDTCLTP